MKNKLENVQSASLGFIISSKTKKKKKKKNLGFLCVVIFITL